MLRSTDLAVMPTAMGHQTLTDEDGSVLRTGFKRAEQFVPAAGFLVPAPQLIQIALTFGCLDACSRHQSRAFT